MVAEKLEHPEPDGRLRDGAVKQGDEAAVQARDAMVVDRPPHAVPDALVARRVQAFVQLQLRLHVLGGESDADFDVACQDRLPRVCDGGLPGRGRPCRQSVGRGSGGWGGGPGSGLSSNGLEDMGLNWVLFLVFPGEQ